MKMFFLDEQDAQEHEAQPDEVFQLFGLADRLSEAELDKLAKIVDNFRPEAMNPSQ